ncbi:S8 family peptidase [Deinococcus malanensis]|uniref:S8 family peptidase n=1 Tax=Deinococcus malanensis TaxID=1706855 RepID=UPI0036271652
MQASGLVRFAEPNWIYQHQATSNDPYYTDGTLWGMYGNATSPANGFGSQAGEAWAANHIGSKNVYIGVIDEGIQFTHPDLAANIWLNPFDAADGVDNDGNGYVDDTRGWDFANGNNTIYDGNKREGTDEHGTHVAGTIGGVGGNGVGVAGVNWNVTMISGKFLGSRGGTTANAIKAVDYFTDLKTRHKLNIVATSNSWGGGGFSQGLLDAINRGGDAGILFIAAAGNGGSDGVGDNNDTTANYPSNYECTANGTYDCVIAVAAIDKAGALAKFSNYGANTVDLGAPGVSVMSTLPKNTYGAYSGTSMATPHVSGGAALHAATSGATGAALKKAIMDAATTTPTASMNGKSVTNGRLNVSGF